MLEYLKNIETSIKLAIFFGSIIVTLLAFSINGYNNVSKALVTISENQVSLNELNKFKDIKISIDVACIYDRVIVKGVEDLHEKERQLLTLYLENLNLSIDDKYKIEQILK